MYYRCMSLSLYDRGPGDALDSRERGDAFRFVSFLRSGLELSFLGRRSGLELYLLLLGLFLLVRAAVPESESDAESNESEPESESEACRRLGDLDLLLSLLSFSARSLSARFSARIRSARPLGDLNSSGTSTDGLSLPAAPRANCLVLLGRGT